jgi:hypothetical protein
MAVKGDLADWIVEALRSSGGAGTILSVAKYIWDNYEDELRASGDLFYTWQYDTRWQATELRRRGILVRADDDQRRKWTLK